MQFVKSQKQAYLHEKGVGFFLADCQVPGAGSCELQKEPLWGFPLNNVKQMLATVP